MTEPDQSTPDQKVAITVGRVHRGAPASWASARPTGAWTSS